MELPIRLKTAGEMYQYSCDNGFGTGFGRNWGLRNFLILEKKLEEGEAAFLTFVGLHRFHSMSAHQRNFAYAITDRRILMGQSRSFWRTRFESVPLNGVLKMMLEKDAVTVGMSRECADALSRKLTELLPLIQELAHGLEGGGDGEQEEQ